MELTFVTDGNEMFLDHPGITKEKIMRRDYQVTISTKALQRPTLVVLPTGLGKTIVALIVIAERIRQGAGKVLMVAPTKPLVEQHWNFMSDNLVTDSIIMLTGEVPPGKRKERYDEARMVISTPQVIKNDIITGDLDISGFSTLVVDEAHRASGDYPYVFISEMFYEKNPEGLSLGLTASPGHDVSRIYEVCRNLGMESIEVRVDSDPDVKPYIQEMEVKRVKVDLSEGMRSILKLLERMFLDRISKLQRMGLVRKGSNTSIKELLGAAGRIQEMIKRAPKQGGSYYQAMSIQAQAMKISHAMELAETQGMESLYQYLDRMVKETGNPDCSKATRKVVSDPLFNIVMNKAQAMTDEVPPKVIALERAVVQKLREDPDSRIIAFTHFRDTATIVYERLNHLFDRGVKPVKFVGQASRGDDSGLSQKKQKLVLDSFRKGHHNVLIATSVAEEGLDIPGADLVIFYEPIPSEIRTIQRRGRTGRHSSGHVIVLISRETRDVAYSFSARDKEMKMERQLLSLRRMLSKNPLPKKVNRERKVFEANKEPTLDEFSDEDEKPEIIIDQREMSSSVAEELMRLGFKVTPNPLGEGDYRISDRIAIERKTAQDLSDSLVDGRLFDQARRLSEAYERPMILIEGDNILGRRRIDPAALYGALSSIAFGFNIPLMFTSDPRQTAEFMSVVHSRENKGKRSERIIRKDQSMTKNEIGINVISGLPGISKVLASRMIEKFGSLANIFKATEEELKDVDGIGKAKAREVYNLINNE